MEARRNLALVTDSATSHSSSSPSYTFKKHISAPGFISNFEISIVLQRLCSHLHVYVFGNLHQQKLHAIRKYGSTSYMHVRVGPVQNGVLYSRYRSNFAIMKAECCKAFTPKKTPLFYCRKCFHDSANLSQIRENHP